MHRFGVPEQVASLIARYSEHDLETALAKAWAAGGDKSPVDLHRALEAGDKTLFRALRARYGEIGAAWAKAAGDLPEPLAEGDLTGIWRQISLWQSAVPGVSAHTLQILDPWLHAYAVRLCGSWRRANEELLQAMNQSGTLPVLADLRALRAQGVPLCARAVQAAAPDLYQRVRSLTHRFAMLVRSMGLNPEDEERRWLVDVIRKFHAAGVALNHGAIQQDLEHRWIYAKAYQLFGSWQGLLDAANLDYTAVRKTTRWTQDRVIAEVRKAAGRGESLNRTMVTRSHPNLVYGAIGCFGSWDGALRAAGLNPEEIRLTKPSGYWTVDRIVEAIHQRASNGGALHASSCKMEDRSLYTSAVRTCGSWDAALKAAGKDPDRIRRKKRGEHWTDDRVLASIRERMVRGESLGHLAVHRSDRAMLNAATRLFGSWGAAVTAAGVDYVGVCHKKPRGYWTPERIVGMIRERADAGLPLTIAVMEREERPLLSAAIRRFGSWRLAVEEAGANAVASRS